MSDYQPNFSLDLTVDSDEDDMCFSQILSQDVQEHRDILNKALIQWDSDCSFGKSTPAQDSEATASAR